jgi:ABC-type Mn2+/Zn2+ transport system ATPase subunit
VIGGNGAGKSTLLKTIVGIVRPSAGTVLWREQPFLKNSYEIAYLPQRERIDWNFPVTVRGLVEMGRYPLLGSFRPFGQKDREAVEKAMEWMEITRLENRQIGALSGGQQQRAFIARALAQEAHVLLLDEPFSGLDRSAQDSLAGVLRSLTRKGRLIIVAHHDLGNLETVFDRVLVLNHRVLAFGAPREVLNAELLSRAY